MYIALFFLVIDLTPFYIYILPNSQEHIYIYIYTHDHPPIGYVLSSSISVSAWMSLGRFTNNQGRTADLMNKLFFTCYENKRKLAKRVKVDKVAVLGQPPTTQQ